MFPGYRLNAIDAVTCLNTVQINRQDPFFRPEELDQNGEIGLQPLSQPRRPKPEEEIFGRLLADGACSTGTLTGLVLLECLFNLNHVKTVVIEETLILRSKHRTLHVVGDLRVRDPPVAYLRLFTINELFHHPYTHQRGEMDWKKPVSQYRRNAPQNKIEHNLTNKPGYLSHDATSLPQFEPYPPPSVGKIVADNLKMTDFRRILYV